MKESTPQSSIIYCRVSSHDQIEGTSLDSQERLCREYAERQSWAVLGVFIEAGESAKTADRTELNKAIAFCRQKRVGFFVVYKIDRFARNQDDHVTVRAMLRRHGTELRSVTEPIDDTPIGRALEGMLSVFSEFDNNVRTERTKQGMLERVKEGIWVWPSPIGYLRANGNLAPDPSYARFVVMAFETFAGGRCTYGQLAHRLASKGFRTRRGRKPNGQLMHRIIHNPVYTGTIRLWNAEYRGAFPPLVSRALFDSCQSIRRRAVHTLRRRNPHFPLRGLIVCAECGKRFTGSTPRGEKGGRYPYYHHSTLRHCSKSRAIPKADLERLFSEVLLQCAFNGDFEESLQVTVRQGWNKFESLMRDEQYATERAIGSLEAERQEIFKLHRRGVYNDEQFHEQLALVTDQMRILAARPKALNVSSGQLATELGTAVKYLRTPHEMWRLLADFPDQRFLWQERVFIKPLTFDGERFGTPVLSPIYRLKAETDGSESHLGSLVRRDWNLIRDELRFWSEFDRELNEAKRDETILPEPSGNLAA